VGRDKSKGEAAVLEIVEASGNKKIEFLSADMSLMSEARRVAKHVRETFNDRVDILIPCAGGNFPNSYTLTSENIELNFALQYLSRFILINELLPLLRQSSSPKIIIIAGAANYRELDFDNLQRAKDYGGKFSVIPHCAALNYLLTLGMSTRHPNVGFYNYDSGPVRTATIYGNSKVGKFFMDTIGQLFTRAPQQAADDIVKLLSDDKYAQGGFYNNKLEKQAFPKKDNERSDRLWEYSEALIGNYPPRETGWTSRNCMIHSVLFFKYNKELLT